MKKNRLGLGLVIGAVAGTITGFLTAPKSGKETREDLKKKALEKREMVEEKVNEVTKIAGEKADEIKQKTDDMKSCTTQAFKSEKVAFGK